MRSAITDIPWVRTDNGTLTVEQALLRAHEIAGLDLAVPALEVGATYRLLSQVFALAVREMGADYAALREGQLDPDAVARAIEQIGTAADLFDPEQPFMQRPALESAGAKDKERKIGRGDHPVKKLFPFMPSDQAELFWGLSVETDDALDLPEATRTLVVFHNYSMAGNNRYDGDKCQMGAPGIRFPGKDNTATEIVWRGPNLLETLCVNTPRSWVEDGGLPAWADRTGEKSRDAHTNELPALWTSSWSSNAPVCFWEDGMLAGVRTGGVPAEWRPLKGGDDKALKQWWDNRNTQDPFYLYVPDRTGEPRAQRLDIERDTLDLAVEWNANSKADHLRSDARQHLATPRQRDLIFLRHQVGGTASSPSIRASEVLVGDRDVWAPDEDAAEDVREFSALIRNLHFTVTSPFRRGRASDKPGETHFIDALESRRDDASAYFWREITDAFGSYMGHVQTDPNLTEQDVRALRRACMSTFDQAAAPYWGQHRYSIEQVRAEVEKKINALVNIERTEG